MFGAVIRSFQRQSCRNNGAQTELFIIFVLRIRAERTRIARTGGPLHHTDVCVVSGLRFKTILLRNLHWVLATRARVHHHQLYLNEVARWSPRPAPLSRGSPRLGANGRRLWRMSRMRLRRGRSWIVCEIEGMDHHPRRGCPALPSPQLNHSPSTGR